MNNSYQTAQARAGLNSQLKNYTCRMYLWQRFILILIWVVVYSSVSEAQSKPTAFIVRGKVTVAETGEPIYGAHLYIENATGTTTNAAGNYFVYLPAGNYVLSTSAVGYETDEQPIAVHGDTIIHIALSTSIEALDEVVVTTTNDRVKSIGMGLSTVNLQTIKKIPALLGEPDLIRSLLLMPGVSTVGEGATGFNVRGGGVDQNLVLLDDAPVFNTSHVFGFLTAFNTNAIAHADLYKSGIPAQFGGRAASVLDIRLRQGNMQQLHGQASLGLMTASASADGPLSNKTTYLLSLRSSYSDWLLKVVPENSVRQSRASFYDGIAKVTHAIGKNHQLSLGTYHSQDSFQFPGDTVYGWRTQNYTLKWAATLKPNIFLMTSVVSGNYQYLVDGIQRTNEFTWQAGIRYQHVKSDVAITYSENHKGMAGLGAERYAANQGELIPDDDSNINPFTMGKETGWVYSAFYQHSIDFTDKLGLMVGMRVSVFQLLGAGAINQYQPGQPKSSQTWLGLTNYDKGEKIISYTGFEPRLSLKYSINGRASLKFGFDQTWQYLHLVSNTSAISPIDLWKLSGPYIKPQLGRQLSVGYFQAGNKKGYTYSTEVYFKIMQHVVDYKDGAELLLNDKLEADLLQGDGRAYGAEWMVEKTAGRLTGWMSYTLSRTERKVAGPTIQETINQGSYYPANFDRLHNVNLTGSYQKTKRVAWGFNFTVASGRPVTYPTASYGFGGVRVVNYELRNNGRTPAYHRLDISLTIKNRPRGNKKTQGEWVASLYNVYARKNPYSIFFRSNYGTVPQPYRLAVIGTIVPSLAYHITF
jgi:hypothetical protein